MNRRLRAVRVILAAAAATAVGVTTHDAGFIVITFLGSLFVLRQVGLGGRGGFWRGDCGGGRDAWLARRSHLEQRLAGWHEQAHGNAPSDRPGGASSAGASQA
jgi:hypothetical protein